MSLSGTYLQDSNLSQGPSRDLVKKTFFHLYNGIVFDPSEPYNFTRLFMNAAKAKFDNDTFTQADADLCSMLYWIENIRMDNAYLNEKLQYNWKKWEPNPWTSAVEIEKMAIPRVALFKKIEVILSTELEAYKLGKDPVKSCVAILKKLTELHQEMHLIILGNKTAKELFIELIFSKDDLGKRYIDHPVDKTESTTLIMFTLSFVAPPKPYTAIDESLATLMLQKPVQPKKAKVVILKEITSEEPPKAAIESLRAALSR